MKSVDDYVESIVRPEIRALKAYAVPASDGFIKLDAMENPFGVPASLRDAWMQRLHDVPINRYPSASAEPVKEALRRQMRLSPDVAVVLGNGSDEIIQMLIAGCCDERRGVLTVEPGFVMYAMIARYLRVPYHAVPLDEDFALDGEALLRADREHQPGVIFIAQPNNPTGNLFAQDVIEALIQQTDALVVIDEAYLPFAANDSLPLMAKYPNVVVMRTLSKAGFAGLRLGFLLASAAWAAQIEKLRLPYNINTLTQVSAAFLLEHYAIFQKQTDEICQQREQLYTALKALQVFSRVYASRANFILARTHQGEQAKAIHAHLLREHVLVKCLHGAHPMLEGCLRFTVGTAEENAALLAALALV